MGDGIDAVDEEDGGTASAGLVVAAPDRGLAERPSLVEVAERHCRVDDPAPDDRQPQVGRGVSGREVDIGLGLREQHRLTGRAIGAWSREAAVDDPHERIRLVDRDDQLEDRLVEVEELTGDDAAYRRGRQSRQVLRDLRIGPGYDLVVTGACRREARDADERPVDPFAGERPRDGRVSRDEADPGHDRDQRRGGPDGRHRDQSRPAPPAEAREDQRRDRGHRRMVTYQRR